MVQKRTCDYSGQEIEPGTGTMLVKKNGTVLWFADAKCEKNYRMGREARDLEWIGDDRERRDTTEAEAETAPDSEEPDADADADEDEDEEDADAEDVESEGDDTEDAEAEA